MFCGKNGDILKENDTIIFTRLAETYRKIAEDGPNAFYQGPLAQNLVTDIQAAGSIFFFILLYLRVDEHRLYNRLKSSYCL